MTTKRRPRWCNAGMSDQIETLSERDVPVHCEYCGYLKSYRNTILVSRKILKNNSPYILCAEKSSTSTTYSLMCYV